LKCRAVSSMETSSPVDWKGVWRLAAISFLTLFAEVVFIRYLSAETRIFGFYKNLALIACFLGMGTGAVMSDASVQRCFVPGLPRIPMLGVALTWNEGGMRAPKLALADLALAFPGRSTSAALWCAHCESDMCPGMGPEGAHSPTILTTNAPYRLKPIDHTDCP